MALFGCAFNMLGWEHQLDAFTQSVWHRVSVTRNFIELIWSGNFRSTLSPMLATSNVFSVMYYNSEIWHQPFLNSYLKALLLKTFTNILKVCTPSYNQMMSYQFTNKRATPTKFMKYKLALMLYKINRDKYQKKNG